MGAGNVRAVVGELIAGRYELEELIGSGGMSNVYRAHDRLLERKVALKILHEHFSRDDDYVERFRREARLAAQLSHPNIVTVIDRGGSEGRQFIVFEYVEGENLKELLGRRGGLPVRSALELGLQIAAALAFAHENGLVHRDVKPQNVLLGDGPAKVTDFGIARSVDVRHGLTQTGTVLGTSDYISPEQASGEHVDSQTDVYSLGAVLYELLTGEPPFSGESFVAVALRHLNDPPPSVLDRRPDVPVRLDEAMRRAMAKNPRDRPTMEELAAELRACLGGLTAVDEDATAIMRPQPALPARPRRTRRRRTSWPGAALVGGLAVIAAAAAIVVVQRRNGDGGAGGAAGTSLGPPLAVAAVATYDPPPGDGREHDERISFATDGDPATHWSTERYSAGLRGSGKQGVGLVLDAGRPVELARLALRSNTPGFRAEIRAGASKSGPFDTVSRSRRVQTYGLFPLTMDEPQQYYVIWITELAAGFPRTHVNEVTARLPR